MYLGLKRTRNVLQSVLQAVDTYHFMRLSHLGNHLLCLCTEAFHVEPNPNTDQDQENAKTRDEQITRSEPMRPGALQRNHKQDSPI